MSNQFNHNTLVYLKKLSRIDCSAEEGDRLLHDLERILGYMAQLDEVDTEKTEPCSHILKALLRHPLREDQVEECLPRETFLANAPDQVGGMIRTPPVLKAL